MSLSLSLSCHCHCHCHCLCLCHICQLTATFADGPGESWSVAKVLAVEGGEVNNHHISKKPKHHWQSHHQQIKTPSAITSLAITSLAITSVAITSVAITSVAWTRPTKSHLWMYHTTSHNSNVVSYFHYMILTASILKYGDQILGLYNAVSPLLELLRHNRHHHQYHHDR